LLALGDFKFNHLGLFPKPAGDSVNRLFRPYLYTRRNHLPGSVYFSFDEPVGVK
jgi:hypothetical protein